MSESKKNSLFFTKIENTAAELIRLNTHLQTLVKKANRDVANKKAYLTKFPLIENDIELKKLQKNAEKFARKEGILASFIDGLHEISQTLQSPSSSFLELRAAQQTLKNLNTNFGATFPESLSTITPKTDFSFFPNPTPEAPMQTLKKSLDTIEKAVDGFMEKFDPTRELTHELHLIKHG